eukprot:6185490-Pleurochrysis_carterae.AAC.1
MESLLLDCRIALAVVRVGTAFHHVARRRVRRAVRAVGGRRGPDHGRTQSRAAIIGTVVAGLADRESLRLGFWQLRLRRSQDDVSPWLECVAHARHAEAQHALAHAHRQLRARDPHVDPAEQRRRAALCAVGLVPRDQPWRHDHGALIPSAQPLRAFEQSPAEGPVRFSLRG